MRPDDVVASDPVAQRPVLRLDEERRRRLRPWAIAGAAAVILVTGGVALSYTPLVGARTVEVEGTRHLTRREVLALAQVGVGTNVMHLDEEEAEARLEGDPWIRGAVVKTELPGSISITVHEREPLVWARIDGAAVVVAADGTPLGSSPRGVDLPEIEPAPGSSLDRATLRVAGGIVQAMAPSLRARVETLTLAADGVATLTIDRGIDVRYGAPSEAAAKAQALLAILAYAEDQGRALASIDVSAPAAPTARFVGDQQVASMPDPSAALAGDAAEAAGPGDGPRVERPSPSPASP